MVVATSWDKALSTEASNDILKELALKHISSLSKRCYEEIGLTLARQIELGDYLAICSTPLDYSSYGPLDIYHISQSLAFYKKRGDLEVAGIDKKSAAWAKWKEAEQRCLDTNHMFRSWSLGRFMFLPDVDAALFAAQRKISNILGDVPSIEDLEPRFGPGATTQVQKRKACAKLKLSQKPACSEEMIPLANTALSEIPRYTFEFYGDTDADTALVDVEVHPGRISFVPKSFKEDRVVVVEPWLNTMFQIAIGDVMTSRFLRKAGIDLTDQTINKRLAKEGSITGALATLDLSSASDTISTGLVEHLLPYDWYELLSGFRTAQVDTPDGSKRQHKFSSMGNGFTFPLESIIFWALAQSVCTHGKVSVFGDDIVCPTNDASRVVRLLECVGFTVNKEKSFVSGPFRESCGGDYLSGIDVRPCFIKGPLRGHDLFRLHNFYVRAGLPDFALEVRKHISDDIALTGPDGFGDGVLIGDWHGTLSEKYRKRGYGGTTFESWCYSKRSFSKRLPGDRVLPAYSIYLRGDLSEDALERSLYEDRIFMAWLENQDPDNAPSFYESLGRRFLRDGTPVEFLPGTKGCKKISIYTFL